MIGKAVGHYRITSKLGAGGMGEVFLAQDTRLRRKAAIKFLPADVAADPERRSRFLSEARAASALNHPHVCIVYDVGETEDGFPFIAMEFVAGQSLDVVAKQNPLEISRVVNYSREIIQMHCKLRVIVRQIDSIDSQCIFRCGTSCRHVT